MESAYTLFLQIVRMFVMMGVGYFLYRKKLTNDSLISGLSNLLLFVATPATLINSFLQEYQSEKVPGLLFSFAVSLVLYLIFIVSAELIYKKDKPVDKFAIVFSNAGFVGIPLVIGVFGNKAVFYLAPYIGMFYLFVFTYGVYIMSGSRNEISVSKVVTNPCIIAVVLGVVLFLLRGYNLPLPVKEAVSGFAGLNTPLAMIVLGAHVARGNIKDVFTNKDAYIASILRLFVMPLITVLLLTILPARWNEIKLILLIGASAPVGALSPVFANMYNRDSVYGASTVCLSTLLSIISMPLIMMAANLLWF